MNRTAPVKPSDVHKGDWILDSCGFAVEVVSRRRSRDTGWTRINYRAYDHHGQVHISHHLMVEDWETVDKVLPA